MFSKKCFCKENISKIVRPLSAALSVNGLIKTLTRLHNATCIMVLASRASGLGLDSIRTAILNWHFLRIDTQEMHIPSAISILGTNLRGLIP